MKDRIAFFVLVGLCVLASLSTAPLQSAPIDLTAVNATPTTQPAVQSVLQATVQQLPKPIGCDVYLTPFTPLGTDNALDWAGKAVQQNLLTDLARARLHPLASDNTIPNAADAQSAAKNAGAKYLISGTYQVADQQVRFNGQMIDVASGTVIGGISTTGPIRDLFKMEDALSTQAIQQLTQLPAIATAGIDAGPNNPRANPPAPLPAAPAVVVQIVQPPAAPVPPVAGAKYQGSALEQYVNSNRNPSADFNLPPLDSQLNDNFASIPGTNYNASTVNYANTYGIVYGPYGGYGLGGYGLGLVYSLPPYSTFGYGTDGHHHPRPNLRLPHAPNQP